MPTTDQDKPGGKNRQRNRKPDQPVQKPEQQLSPMLDHRAEDQIEEMIALAPAGSAPMAAENHPVSLQTIANAYGDYTRKSLLESTSFVEKLVAVRSLDRAIEVQTEFTRQTYATFIAESQRIYDLYRELTGRILQHWGFAARTTGAGLASWPGVASQSKH